MITDIDKIDFEKGNGLVPVVVQDETSLQVLMVGYMNREALKKSISIGRVTFFSRTKNRLWTKGETSGNYLNIASIVSDCDDDTLLIMANPMGVVCHTGSISCFGGTIPKGFLYKLEKVISQRIDENVEGSYSNRLFKSGINKIAQKVGEEAVEVIIEAKDNRIDLFKGEVADLLYHLLILLKAKGVSLEEVEETLADRRG